MDARALLRAKKAAASSSPSASSSRPSGSSTSGPSSVASTSAAAASVGAASDEYATRTKGGEIKCKICGVIVKYWQPHLSSKQHKQSLARERAAQAKLQASQAPKRSLVEQDQQDEVPSQSGGVEDNGYGMNGKRALGDNESGPEGGAASEAGPSKRRRIDEGAGSAQAVADPTTAVDSELDDFLSSLTSLQTSASTTITSEPTTKPSTAKQPYRLAQAETQTSYESAPVRLVHDSGTAGTGAAFGKGGVANGAEGPVAGEDQGEEDEEPEVKETNAERVRRERREERDEILGRLEEEQRAQEEADQRVVALKAKFDLIKQKRREAAEAKAKAKSA